MNLHNLLLLSVAVDMWAVGCIAYELKRGQCKTPFVEHDPSKRYEYRTGLKNVYRYVEDGQLQDFVLKCLHYDPARRLSAAEAMRHR